LSVAGKIETEWSEWNFVPFVKEGGPEKQDPPMAA
jgi:hypothetical protein